jgi:hypothetical protein
MTAVATSWNSCFCECHSVIPVFINDRVHAATACSKCHDAHVQKYDKDEPPIIPSPADACGDSTEYEEPNYKDKGEGRES